METLMSTMLRGETVVHKSLGGEPQISSDCYDNTLRFILSSCHVYSTMHRLRFCCISVRFHCCKNCFFCWIKCTVLKSIVLYEAFKMNQDVNYSTQQPPWAWTPPRPLPGLQQSLLKTFPQRWQGRAAINIGLCSSSILCLLWVTVPLPCLEVWSNGLL